MAQNEQNENAWCKNEDQKKEEWITQNSNKNVIHNNKNEEDFFSLLNIEKK